MTKLFPLLSESYKNINLNDIKFLPPARESGKDFFISGDSGIYSFLHSVIMDPFKGQGGIQMLLTAEQEAQHIVSSARNLRTLRLKQAKEEAEREAVQYRSHMEEEYQKSISETTGSSGSNVRRLEEETDAKIRNLKRSASKVSSEVVDMLLKYVSNIKV